MTAVLGPAELALALPRVLTPALGTGVRIENLRALTGGASRTTWAFDAVTGEQHRALILRTGPQRQRNGAAAQASRMCRSSAAMGAGSARPGRAARIAAPMAARASGWLARRTAVST